MRAKLPHPHRVFMQQRRFLRLTEASTSRRADAVGGPLSWWRLLVRQLACLQAKVKHGLSHPTLEAVIVHELLEQFGIILN